MDSKLVLDRVPVLEHLVFFLITFLVIVVDGLPKEDMQKDWQSLDSRPETQTMGLVMRLLEMQQVDLPMWTGTKDESF